LPPPLPPRIDISSAAIAAPFVFGFCFCIPAICLIFACCSAFWYQSRS
jgi:hypothetical protein